MTWNPMRGCTKISPGCKNCYAAVFAERWRGVPGHAYEQGFDLRLVPEHLSDPMKTRKPTLWFVNSMSDLFHESVPFEFIAAVFGIMAGTPRHTYQVLTKRPARMREFFAWVEKRERDGREMFPHDDPTWRIWQMLHVSARRAGAERLPEHHGGAWPLRNVWLGVSVEDRKYGLPRIDELRATLAAVRFLSIEPLLEDLGTIDLNGIDLVIVGGESGHSARPMHPQWVRSIRDQVLGRRNKCASCGGTGALGLCEVCAGRGWLGPAFFFKQWGEWCDPYQLPDETARLLDAAGHDNTEVSVKVGKKASGRLLDGRTWDEMPRLSR